MCGVWGAWFEVRLRCGESFLVTRFFLELVDIARGSVKQETFVAKPLGEALCDQMHPLSPEKKQ